MTRKVSKIAVRWLLLVIAIAVGCGLGYTLLVDFEPVKIIIFAIACPLFGNLFYQIDKRISKE
jgi:hypothetical protein